ncbi:type IV pilus modification protein PilV [Ningiella sp. W23]|uniref:type IV pilus modification protein PilV n=1 Tax=Ningiella sp. W23 TaxID=3023715 RepID=UPI003757DEC6
MNQVINKQRGVGMIEVLITLFILSIGLLGVASMQFVGSFSNKDALARTQAVMVAQQFSERLRASVVPSDTSDGFIVDNEYYDPSNYNFAGMSCPSGDIFACHCESIPASVPDCETNQCDADEVAQFDAYQMSCATVQSNPFSRIELQCNDQILGDADLCSAGSIQSIVVTWPSSAWQDNDRVKNAECNPGDSDDNDCVIVQVAL